MIARADLVELLKPDHPAPCVSIYLPMQRRFPEQQQNEIRYRNLLKQVEAAERRTDGPTIDGGVMVPLRDLLDDGALWAHPQDGLAVFAAPGFFRAYLLPRTVPEQAVVAATFQIKPLLRIVQAADRYQVLALNRVRIRLYEGNRDQLEQIDLAPGVPSTIEEALGEELTEEQVQIYSYGTGPAGGAGGGRNLQSGAKTGGVRHGQGSKRDEVDLDTERFFRAVDRAILEHHSRPSGLPLVLAALPEYHTHFRKLSHNPHVVDTGVDINPDALDEDQLRERSWSCIEPGYRRRLQALTDRYGAARAVGRAADGLPEVALAAAVGRVDVLLLEGDRYVPGSMDPETGALQIADTVETPAPGDVLDDLAEAVLRHGGEVIIVPKERTPSTTGLAAIYRY
jgi:hypothetical protein